MNIFTIPSHFHIHPSDSFRVFLPAADIPRFVGHGSVDLGITGQDVVREAQMDDLITELLPLSFGKCKLQIQVPEHGPIKTVEDLAGKRVVTSFDNIADDYFSKLDEKLGLTGSAKTTIEYIGGSVEAACALGLADGIGQDLNGAFFLTLTQDVYSQLI